jgi:hypothetical protein
MIGGNQVRPLPLSVSLSVRPSVRPPPLRRHCAATAPPLRRHCAATAPPLRRHCAATAPPLRRHCAAADGHRRHSERLSERLSDGSLAALTALLQMVIVITPNEHMGQNALDAAAGYIVEGLPVMKALHRYNDQVCGRAGGRAGGAGRGGRMVGSVVGSVVWCACPPAHPPTRPRAPTRSIARASTTPRRTRPCCRTRAARPTYATASQSWTSSCQRGWSSRCIEMPPPLASVVRGICYYLYCFYCYIICYYILHCCLPAYLPACLPTYPPTHPPTHPPTRPPTAACLQQRKVLCGG